MSEYSISLFIFRRDLRIHDNTALNQALRLSQKVIPCFIFDPKQIKEHPYQSRPGLQFMLHSIKDLQQQFKSCGSYLNCFSGSPEAIIKKLHLSHNIAAVFINRDYSPYSRQRDHKILKCCQGLNIELHYISDALLTEPEQILKSDGTPYRIFTPFYNKALLQSVALPQTIEKGRFHSVLSNDQQYDFSPLEENQPSMAIQTGGRHQALQILDQLDSYSNYKDTRDIPSIAGTTQLSAHLKFGSCSAREVLYATQIKLGTEHPLIKQLYWRDFFTHIGFHYPQVFGQSFYSKYDAISWENNLDLFQAWTLGKTGFPIVDAGMRELNKTGFMHNRVRMITASFLVKDLHIDWRWGERYFAQHLVDYDPCVNNGNWQWAASTGCDAQPYFRIFNPWLQQQKFDPECRYIYHWIPELKDVAINIIQKWDKQSITNNYPLPIIDHKIESIRSKQIYKNC